MSLEDRVEATRQMMIRRYGIDPKGLQFVGVVCNRCGAYVFASTLDEVVAMTGDWSFGDTNDEGDYCPNCL